MNHLPPYLARTLIKSFFAIAAISTFLVIFLYALYLTKGVIMPFVVAFIVAYLLNPIVTYLAKYIGRIGGISAVYLSVLGVIVLGISWALPMLWVQLKIMWGYLPAAVDWYNDSARVWLNNTLDTHLIALDETVVHAEVIAYLHENYQAIDAQSFAKRVLASGLSAMNAAGLFVLIPIISFYFLIDWQGRLNTWTNAIPPAYRAKALAIAHDCDNTLMSFVKGQLLVMILLGVIYAVQLNLIGLELGLIIGMTAGIASFVPYLGFGIGFVAAIIAGFLQFGFDWLHLGLIVGAFLVGQAMEGYVLQPFLLGDKIGLSPIWVIFSVMAGASLFGLVGMLIALPVSALINVLFHHAYDAYRSSDWYLGKRQYRLFD